MQKSIKVKIPQATSMAIELVVISPYALFLSLGTMSLRMKISTIYYIKKTTKMTGDLPIIYKTISIHVWLVSHHILIYLIFFIILRTKDFKEK